MKVKVLFFGPTHDLMGFAQEQWEVPEGESVAGLWRSYKERFPRLGEISGLLVVAVNQEIAAPSQLLRDGDEVAFLPPVSGGAGKDVYRLTRDPVHSADLASQLKAPHDGAVVVFEGIVRDHFRGRKTLFLEYEAYEPMALRKMEEIGQEAKGKFAIDRIGMIHRLGRVEIGETSVAIVVAATHRGAAFEACHYAIDRLKQVVPIWKKEHFEDGAVWAESEGRSSLQQSAFSYPRRTETENGY
jgi:molybdopterin synthase catalytic subunit